MNIGKIIDNARLNWFHIRLIVLCGLVVLIDGYDLIAMGMALPTLARDWGMAPSEFGTAMAAALFGVLFGSAFAGYLADRVGRRWTLISMLLTASIFMWMCSMATTMNQLIAYRFFTGFGAGGSIPVAIALTSEYVPARYRNLLVIVMYVGAPFGSVVGGFFGPQMIEQFDWEGIFYLGSVLPLLVCVLLAFLLPESIKFLAAAGRPQEQIHDLLGRISPGEELPGNEFYLEEEEQAKGPIGELFGGVRTQMTLILWMIFFSCQFVIFFVSLWLPSVYEGAGKASETALNALGYYNLGAVAGGVVIGWFADRIGATRTLKFAFPFAAVALALLGFSSFDDLLFFSVAFVAGGAAIGTSLCLGPLAAHLYPTHARSTGVGWGLGFGRAGSIIAPYVGAMVLGLNVTIEHFFLISAVSPVISAIGICLLIRIIGDAGSDQEASHQG